MSNSKTGCSGIALGIFGGFLLITLFIGGCALLPLLLPVTDQMREDARERVESAEPTP